MKHLLYILSMAIVFACQTQTQTQTQTAQAPLLNIATIASKTPEEVATQLGKATEMEPIKINGKNHQKFTYKDEAVEIVFINGKADWITITLNHGTFNKTALGILTLPIVEPTTNSPNVLRWKNHEGINSIALFPKDQNSIDYFYIKVLTE